MMDFKFLRGIKKYSDIPPPPYPHICCDGSALRITYPISWYFGEDVGGRQLHVGEQIHCFTGTIPSFIEKMEEIAHRLGIRCPIYDITYFTLIYHRWDILPIFNINHPVRIRYVL